MLAGIKVLLVLHF